MESFRTEVTINKAKQLIQYDSNLLFMGSCFATNIGNYFSENCFNSRVNPFGVLYNPLSIANSLNRLIEGPIFTENEVQYQHGSYHTFYHHSSFNHADKTTFLSQVNESFEDGRAFLKKTNYLFITFGTAWVYKHNVSKKVVSNCHKYPASTFNRTLLSSSEIVEQYMRLIHSIKSVNPSINIIFTVSPVRHWKDGAHGNQISKATLLLAIEQLNQSFDNISYFPAYELLLDDLRDYRFYKDDMLHPSDVAIQYIRNKFNSAFFNEKAKAFEQTIKVLKKASEHRPFNIASEAHQKFVLKHIDKLNHGQKQYPLVSLSNLKRKFEDQLM